MNIVELLMFFFDKNICKSEGEDTKYIYFSAYVI